MKRAFVFPGGRKRGMLASLLKAGAWLNLSGEGSRAEASPEHWRLQRAQGQAREGAQGSEAASQGLSGHGGGALASPTAALGSHTMPCTAPHGHCHSSSQGDACSQTGLEGCECLCRPEDKAKGAMGLLWLFPERNRTCPENSYAALGTVSSPALLCSTMSCANSETGSRKTMGQRAWESCHFLRHREKSQAQMKKHWSHNFKGR